MKIVINLEIIFVCVTFRPNDCSFTRSISLESQLLYYSEPNKISTSTCEYSKYYNDKFYLYVLLWIMLTNRLVTGPKTVWQEKERNLVIGP